MDSHHKPSKLRANEPGAFFVACQPFFAFLAFASA